MNQTRPHDSPDSVIPAILVSNALAGSCLSKPSLAIKTGTFDCAYAPYTVPFRKYPGCINKRKHMVRLGGMQDKRGYSATSLMQIGFFLNSTI